MYFQINYWTWTKEKQPKLPSKMQNGNYNGQVSQNNSVKYRLQRIWLCLSCVGNRTLVRERDNGGWSSWKWEDSSPFNKSRTPKESVREVLMSCHRKGSWKSIGTKSVNGCESNHLWPSNVNQIISGQWHMEKDNIHVLQSGRVLSSHALSLSLYWNWTGNSQLL